MPIASLTKRGVASLPTVSKRTIFYDRDIAGFGLRISPASKRAQTSSSSWLVEYRVGGGRSARKRRIVIGDLTKLDPDQARPEAKAVLARVQLGADPAAEGPNASVISSRVTSAIAPRADAGKRMPQIMQAHVLYPGVFAYSRPRRGAAKSKPYAKNAKLRDERFRCVGCRAPNRMWATERASQSSAFISTDLNPDLFAPRRRRD